jgi:hypothetical protein
MALIKRDHGRDVVAVAGKADRHIMEIGQAFDRTVFKDDDPLRRELIGLVHDLYGQAVVGRLQYLSRVEESEIRIAILQECDIGNGGLGGEIVDLDAFLRPEAEDIGIDLREGRAGILIRRQIIERLQLLRRERTGSKDADEE